MKKLRASAAQRIRLAWAVWGWRPHAAQRAWLLDESADKVAACGRRWGKTECCAVDVATAAIVEPGIKQMIVSPTYDQSRLVFDHVERLLAAHSRSRRLLRSVRTPYPVLTYQGGTVMGRTADEDGRNLRGHAADRVIVDEAAFVRDKVIDEVLRPMLADTNGQLVMVSTPHGRNHFYRAYTSPSVFSVRCPTWDNPHVSADYVSRQRELLTELQFQVEYAGEFADTKQSVFPWAAVEGSIRAVGAPVAEGRMVAGVDWARYGDYTSCAVGSMEGDRFDVMEVVRMKGMTWEGQIHRVSEVLRRWRVESVLMDQTGIGDPLLEMARRTMWEEQALPAEVDGVVFTNSNKRMMMDGLLLGMERGKVGLPDDPVLRREMEFYEFSETEAGNVRMGARAGEHDDTVCAVALAYTAAQRWGWPCEVAAAEATWPTHAVDGIELPGRKEWIK